MTRLSLSCVLCAIVACAKRPEPASTAIDASTPDGPSLSGSIACGSATCGDGEICVQDEHDLGPGSANPQDYSTCIVPTAGCSLAECGGNDNPCSTCVNDMCTPFVGLTALEGRVLSCVSY